MYTKFWSRTYPHLFFHIQICEVSNYINSHNQIAGTNLETLQSLESCPAAVLQTWPSCMALLLPHLLQLGLVDRKPLHQGPLDHVLLPRQKVTDEHGSAVPDPVRNHSTRYLSKHQETFLINNKKLHFIFYNTNPLYITSWSIVLIEKKS